MSANSKRMSQAGGPGMIVLGIVFMATVNAGLGAAFLAIGAALVAKNKDNTDAG